MPIGYFLTWTTYRTWLPGDERGWFKRRRGLQAADILRQLEAGQRMTENALALDCEQRRIVEQTIADHCRIRKWTLHVANCRTNHVHVVITAARATDEVREQLKAWCTRRLKEHQRSSATASNPTLRKKWWTERGWDDYVDDEESLATIIRYVREGQGS